jgi:hypothetical protein
MSGTSLPTGNGEDARAACPGILDRLLSQIGRILEVNELQKVTGPVVEAAWESLVIGQA